MPHISIKAEPIFSVFNFPVTNSFLTSLIVTCLFFFIAVFYHSELKKTHKNTFFYLLHYALRTLYTFFQTIIGNKINVFFSLLGAMFFYIILQNWIGLLPGVGSLLVKSAIHEGELVPLFRGNNSDLNTTIGLAILAVFLIQYYSIKYLGLQGYVKRFFNIKNPVDIFVGVLEVISEFSKVVSFSFRLFGNVFAGEVLITILAFLIPTVLSFVLFPFLVLEIFVGFIQALVFSMLTAVFVNMAISSHHE